MRTEKESVQRTITEEKTWYIAGDGQKFTTEEECKKYEESAEYALNFRFADKLKEIKLNHDNVPAFAYFNLDDAFFGGTCDSTFYVFSPENEEDVKNFIAWLKLKNTGFPVRHYTREEYSRGIRIAESDGDNWEEYRRYELMEELTPGKRYMVVFNYDMDWCYVYDMERYQHALEVTVKAINKWFENQ